MPTTVSLDEFRTLAGRELEPSSWMEISQDRVRQFADATEDHQFIHLDPEKAAKTPFGGTIAHGYLTLSLLVCLNREKAILPEGLAMVINYGSDKVRFLAPVRVGSRIRSTQKIVEVTEKTAGMWLVKVNVTVEIEHATKPAMKAEVLYMYVVR
ncbi:MAG TPA: MaoC family dehydratase [Xanthomonadales bacterium]|nr:MaoC family dehydratase [Xanthomonadales bacterium]